MKSDFTVILRDWCDLKFNINTIVKSTNHRFLKVTANCKVLLLPVGYLFIYSFLIDVFCLFYIFFFLY